MTRFLSINDLRARWSCSRSTVCRAIAEMDRSGYLRRVFIGRTDQRIALESVETWERVHSAPRGEDRRAAVVEMRRRNAPRPRATPAARQGPSLRERWRAMRTAA